MDALELALRCSTILMKAMARGALDAQGSLLLSGPVATEENDTMSSDSSFKTAVRPTLDESDCERHFNGILTHLALKLCYFINNIYTLDFICIVYTRHHNVL